MVKIIVLPEAKFRLHNALLYAKIEFGDEANKRFGNDANRIFRTLSNFPNLYAKIDLLAGIYEQEFRGATVRKNFKFVYFYDKTKNEVIIVDLWDLRMPEENRLRQIERVIRRNRL